MYKNEKNAKTPKENNHQYIRVNQAIIQVWNQSQSIFNCFSPFDFKFKFRT